MKIEPCELCGNTRTRPDPQLCQFYGVSTYPQLVEAQEYHIQKLQGEVSKHNREQLTPTQKHQILDSLVEARKQLRSINAQLIRLLED